MDELKSVEKSISELKTIQNRLKKLLKDREWTLSYELPRLVAIIENKKVENESQQIELKKLKSKMDSKKDRLKKMRSLIEKTQIEKQQFEKENEKLRSKILELKSDYLYRSHTAKTQFYEEKFKQLKVRIDIQEKLQNGNFMNFDKIVNDYRQSLLLEIETLERRNKTLEKMNEELLKENNKLRKNSI